MNTIRLCPGCGAALPPDAPAGLCPACLLRTQVPAPAGACATSHRMPVPGERFGDYEILRRLGHGGMGEVYEAAHISSGRRVALKVMRHNLSSEADRKRFFREGRLAASVTHPNVVYVHGSDEIDGVPAIAMELVHDGTLMDRLKRGGPLPVAEAVEAVLQVITGLEAAHAAGVLHRDIKPANCFVAADGTVKVGDFGLSISTVARGESLITASGSVLGTPTYASPEQLRGEELDVASDIYSVGATLYHLLTGHTPFEGDDFVKLITEVLDKEPADPRRWRAVLPDELVEVLRRCLAKDRRQRFASYTALRDALLPFRAAELVPARLGLRFLASVVDELVAQLPAVFFMAYWGLDPLQMWQRDRTWIDFAIWLPFALWTIGFYAVAEGRWGAGPGKALCGLRVARLDGLRPGLGRAALRALVYQMPFMLPVFAYVVFVSKAESLAAAADGHAVFTDWAWLPLFALWMVTLRKRNGWAMVHDLVSGTRVVVRPRTQPRPANDEVWSGPAGRADGVTGLPATLGPYEVLAELWRRGGERLWLGLDPVLRRRVWLHCPEGAGAGTARHDLSRGGRLHWLNGGVVEGRAWDAYDAPEGTSLLSLARGGRPWSTVRFWLLDLTEEMRAGLQHPCTAAVATPERAWITRDGRAVLLDFPAPGAAVATVSSEGAVTDEAAAQRFLAEVARVALEGAATATPGTAAVRARVPLHARAFLESLVGARFDKIEVILGNLHSLVSRPAEVSPGRRAASLLAVPASLVALGLLIGAMVFLDEVRAERDWAAAHPGLPSLRRTAGLYLNEAANNPESRNARLVRIYLAEHYAQFLTNAAAAGDHVHRAGVDEPTWNTARDAVSRPVEATAEERADALELVPRWVEKHDVGLRLALFLVLSGGAVLAVVLMMLVELVGAVIFGQHLLLRLFGLALVDAQGRPASRGLLLWRWAVLLLPAGGVVYVLGALSLFVGLHMVASELASLLPLPDTQWLHLGWLLLPALVVLVWMMSRRDRFVHDRIVGTWLVVR